MMGGGAQKMPGQQQDFNKMFTAERGLPYLIRDKDLSFIIKKTLSQLNTNLLLKMLKMFSWKNLEKSRKI